MADVVGVYTSSGLIHTGKGVLQAVTLTCTGTLGVTATFYDNTAGSGTKIFEASLVTSGPLVIFFPDHLAPRFATGLYIALGLTISATVWSRQM
jgi:hypothetical protein